MPFNMYILPYADNYINDKVFSSQLSSLQFLAENKFNFNKLFYESIIYMSLQNFWDYQMRKESGKIKTNEKTPKAFAYDDPDCVVFINQYYI